MLDLAHFGVEEYVVECYRQFKLECAMLSQSQLYGRASMVLLFQFAEVILKRSRSCIIESVFHPSFSMQDLLKLHQYCPFFPLQIYFLINLSFMRYWYDTEFIEDGKAIDLISIAVVAQDGRELYIQSTEFDPSKASLWIIS